MLKLVRVNLPWGSLSASNLRPHTRYLTLLNSEVTELNKIPFLPIIAYSIGEEVETKQKLQSDS